MLVCHSVLVLRTVFSCHFLPLLVLLTAEGKMEAQIPTFLGAASVISGFEFLFEYWAKKKNSYLNEAARLDFAYIVLHLCGVAFFIFPVQSYDIFVILLRCLIWKRRYLSIQLRV